MSELVQEGRLERGTEHAGGRESCKDSWSWRKGCAEGCLTGILFPYRVRPCCLPAQKATGSSRRFFLQFLLQIQRISELLKPKRREWKRQPELQLPCPPPLILHPDRRIPSSIPSVPPTLQVVPTPSEPWSLLLSFHLRLKTAQTAPPSSRCDPGNRIQP